jgi:hypothetical protein
MAAMYDAESEIAVVILMRTRILERNTPSLSFGLAHQTAGHADFLEIRLKSRHHA